MKTKLCRHCVNYHRDLFLVEIKGSFEEGTHETIKSKGLCKITNSYTKKNATCDKFEKNNE